jgi:hypothetical protein
LLENSLNNLRMIVDQIEFKDSSLPLAIFFAVFFHEFETNWGHFLKMLVLLEDWGDFVDIDVLRVVHEKVFGELIS